MTTGDPATEYQLADDEPFYFAYSTSLRVFGEKLDFKAISAALDIQPTDTHRKGDLGPTKRPYDADLWSYTVPLDKSRPLHEHIDELWAKLKPRKDYLIELKRQTTVDVYLGYRSNCEWAGVEVPHTSLVMFVELGIPFGLSIVIA